MTNKMISLRLPEELVERLDNHVSLLMMTTGENQSRSSVIKEAIESYLDGFDSELARQTAIRNLNLRVING